MATEMMFTSPTYGKVSKQYIYNYIIECIKENQITKSHNNSIIVGSDSQNK